MSWSQPPPRRPPAPRTAQPPHLPTTQPGTCSPASIPTTLPRRGRIPAASLIATVYLLRARQRTRSGTRYDANGNKTGMTDATGASSFTYDPFGELTSSTNGATQTTGYGYSPDGQVTSITYPLPASATWATSDTVSLRIRQCRPAELYDRLQRPPGRYHRNSRRSDRFLRVLGSTGDIITTSYDNTDSPFSDHAEELRPLRCSPSATPTLPPGDILTETDIPASSTSPATYSYDAQGRVTSMTPGTGTPHNYTFDASTNLTALPTGATGTYDHAGELTSSTLSGTTTNYTYNADGEQLDRSAGRYDRCVGSLERCRAAHRLHRQCR